MKVTVEVTNDGRGAQARICRRGEWSEPRRLNYIAERNFILLSSFLEGPAPAFKEFPRTNPGDALSARQRATLQALRDLSSSRPPTIRELMTHMGLRGTGWVRHSLLALEKKGFVQNSGGSRGWRALEVS